MADLESLLYAQQTAVQAMTRLLANLKKIGRNNFTPALLKQRREKLDSLWVQLEGFNTQIYIAANAEQRKTLPYFKDQEFVAAENVHYEVSDDITSALTACSPNVNANSTAIGNCTFQDGTRGSYTPLPRLDVPKFSGSYTDWVSFRDQFQSLVINQDAIPNVQKLQYLKVSVQGEASSLLNTITISDANFTIAWDKLKDRYENSRYIIDSYLAKLFDVNAVSTENVKELKKLRDHTYEAVCSLGNLHRPVDQWDDILTFMTVRKLDPVSRREWEMKIGEKKTYPTYNEIHNFLEYRIRALESIFTPSTRKSSKPKGDGVATKSHLSTASKTCDCDESHPLSKCEHFRALAVNQRQKLVREKNLCNNCLASSHPKDQCQSKYACYHCKAKHHTLLHVPKSNKKKGKNEKLSFPAGGGHVAKAAPADNAIPQHSSSTSKVDAKASTSQHVTAAVENLHTVE